ncbi:ribosome biogenesis GTPase Der [Zavarzinia sp. CC-PAN008]|uniref:ribosome biogenesis GTPase Der n=1 Tax=Zavarzinia sp. CC-PAN008 TaxID=3243332 RepID=UPI003F748066
MARRPFTVAIVGRPNVGKSTLFNRLVGKKLALVDDTPGVTRDRREGEARLGPLKFRVFDTAGLEEGVGDTLEARLRRQTDRALGDADAVLFLVDARAGVTPLDSHFARVLRLMPQPVILVANKAEGNAGIPGVAEAYGLGLGDPVPLSAEHGENMSELYDALAAVAPDEGEEPAFAAPEDDPEAFDQDEGEEDAAAVATRPLTIAIAGRPNVGKSTLINRLLGEERMITGPEAGLTRDSIGVPWSWNGRPVRLFDTAGLRRKARVQEKLEKLSVGDTLRAVRFAEIVIVVIDADLGVDKQDLQIADLVAREGRGLVIAVNKWDLVRTRKETLDEIRYRFETSLSQVQGMPLVTLSGLSGQGLDKLMPAVAQVDKSWNTRVPTAVLNRYLAAALERHPPPAVAGRRLRPRYMTQVKSRPPTFALFMTRGGELPDSYSRYLTSGLRENFALDGVPLRLLVRSSDNPYADKDD